jgi:phosphate:Na+ symporter
MKELIIAMAGLGLFLSGLHLLSKASKGFTGQNFRKLISVMTNNEVKKTLIGTTIGIFTQSSSAATFFIMGLVQSQIIKFKDALTVLAWSGVGTSFLVFVASIDIQFLGYILIAILGFLNILKVSDDAKINYVTPFLFSVGLIFLGLGLIKIGAINLRDYFWVNEFFEFASETMIISIVLGLLFTLLTQSASTITMLIVALVFSGVIPFESASFMVIGSNLGSGLALILFFTHLEDQQKRILFFQLITKCAGSFIVWIILLLNPNLFLSGSGESNLNDMAYQLALLYLFLQITGAVFSSVFQNKLLFLLLKKLPDSEKDIIAKPNFLYPEALENKHTAINLINQEQLRLLSFIPSYLDNLRTSQPATLSDLDRHTSVISLCQNIKVFIDEAVVIDQSNDMSDLFRMQSKNESIQNLIITLKSFVDTVNELNIKQSNLSHSMVESLHMILTLLYEQQSSEEGDLQMIESLTSDRGSLMDSIRDKVLADQSLSNMDQKSLFLLTRIFERLLWQVRKHALIN